MQVWILINIAYIAPQIKEEMIHLRQTHAWWWHSRI